MTEGELFELINPALPEGAEWRELEAARQHRREAMQTMDSTEAAAVLLAAILPDRRPASSYECWLPDDQCHSVFGELRDLAPTTGYLPVILGPSGESGFNPPETAAEILGAAGGIDGRQWILDQRDPVRRIEKKRERIAELRSLLEQNPALQTMIEIEEQMLKFEEDSIAEGDNDNEPQMDWPEKDHPSFDELRLRAGHAAVPSDVGEDEGICIAMVPARYPWQIPAFLDFGGWNACPEQEVHCAVLKHWEETYAAELVMMESDTLQLSVARPPRTREEAWQLAGDQNTYAEFDQLGALANANNLASALLESAHWFFWWD